MATKTEVRTFRSGSLRSMSQGDEMVISGRALSYGVLSSDLGGFREQLQRGCFTRSLQSGQDVLCRREHQTGFLLGRTKNGTLQLNDGPDGLDFRCTIDPNDPIAVSTHAAIKSGLVDSMSFAFTVDGNDGEAFDDTKDENGRSIVRRTIKRALLADVAPVAAPAYPQGTSVSARAADYSVPVVAPRTVPTTAAEMRAQIAAFDARQKSLRVQRHLEVRRLFAKYPELSLEHIAQCIKLAYSEDLMLSLRMAAITEKITRAGVAFEAEPMRYDGGQAADPEQKLRDDDDFDDPSDASDKDEHERARDYHRACARKAKTLDAGVAHFKAADAHDKAAQTGDPNDSSCARGTSKALQASFKKSLQSGELS